MMEQLQNVISDITSNSDLIESAIKLLIEAAQIEDYDCLSFGLIQEAISDIVVNKIYGYWQ